MPTRNRVLRLFGDDLQQVISHVTRHDFRPRDIINDAYGEAAYFPISGLISVSALYEGGRLIECALIGERGALGAWQAIGFRPMATISTCLTDVVAWRVPIEVLERSAASSALVRRSLTWCCDSQLAYAIRSIACNSLHSVEQRLARWISYATSILGEPVLRFSQQQIATALGVQRSYINPILQTWQKAGIISLAHARICVVDEELLHDRACECYTGIAEASKTADSSRS